MDREKKLKAYFAALCQYNPGRYIDNFNNAPKEGQIFRTLIREAIGLALINRAFLDRFDVTMDAVESWAEGTGHVSKNQKKKITSFIRKEIRAETGWPKHYGEQFRGMPHYRRL